MKKKLKDVCDFYSGTGFPTQYQGEIEGDYPFYKVGDIANNATTGKIYLELCNNYISKDIAKTIKGCILPKDTVVFAKIGEALKLNRRAITSCECLIDNNAMGIAPKINQLRIQYFFFFMKNLKMQSLAESTTVPSVRKTKLENYEIEVPSMEAQEEIEKKLALILDIIEKRKQELVGLDSLIKARFVELFGDINTNDKNWDCEPLGELCTIVRGSSPRPIEQFLGGDVPWIKIGDATDGDNIYLNSTKEYIIQEGVKKSRLVKAGSLIFANCGVSLGFARIITFDGCIHDGWLAMEDIDERLDKVFLLQALNQMTEHFRAIAPDGTQPNLNTAIMKAFMQVIPPIELQRDFIKFVEQIDKSKVAVQKALDETQLLFDSLMQKYFG
ncbi:MAG: restriction endonuclease subunit S [Mediterraneibacter sp.]